MHCCVILDLELSEFQYAVSQTTVYISHLLLLTDVQNIKIQHFTIHVFLHSYFLYVIYYLMMIL